MRTRRLAIRPFAIGFNMKRMTHGFKVPASAFDRNTHAQAPLLVRGAPKLENDAAEVLQSDAEQRCGSAPKQAHRTFKAPRLNIPTS